MIKRTFIEDKIARSTSIDKKRAAFADIKTAKNVDVCDRSRIEVNCLNGISKLSALRSIKPLKILNPRNLSEYCQVYLSSYGGGLVTGDEITLEIECKANAKLFLGTQAETKIYKSIDGKLSRQSMEGVLHPHSVAVICPDALIPYKGSRFIQKQSWNIDSTATLVLIDWLHAGRSSLGENFEYRLLSSEVEIIMGNEKIILDRLRIEPQCSSVTRVGAFGTYQSYFNLYFVGALSGTFIPKLKELLDRGSEDRKKLWVTLNAVHTKGFVLRVLAKDKQDVFPLLTKILEIFASAELLGFNPLTRKF